MKKTLNEVRQYFVEKGCELLENEYLNAHVKMKYRCSCGNVSHINFNNFRSGKRCGCGRIGLNRLSKIEIKNEVESLGFTYISSNMVNNQHTVKVICKCKLEREVKLKNIRLSDGCLNCRNKKFAFKYQEVFDYFEEQGCQLLDKEYKNARTKLRYVCKCGSESSIVFDSFKRGNRCKKCGNKKNSQKQALSQEQVAKIFEDKGCKLIGEYKKANLPVTFVCKCGQSHKKNLNNFQKVSMCPVCSLSGRSGSNHYEWISDRENKKVNDLFRQKCRAMINICIKYLKTNKNKRTKELLGYTPKQLQEHIFSHKNWFKLTGKKWHLDHIFPIKAFVDYGIKDIKIINCLENLQPLTAVENCVKNDNYDPSAFECWLNSKGHKANL